MRQVDTVIRRADISLAALLCISVVLNVGLTLQLKRAGGTRPTSTPTVTPIGTTLEAVRAKKRDGSAIRIGFGVSQKPLAVYVLSPSCIWCERNLENIRELARQCAGDYRFVGLTTLPIQPLKQESMRLGFEVYEEDPSEPILRKLGIDGTPATVVVSSTGMIEQIWRGAYSRDTASSVQTFFRVRLPGLS